MIDIANLEWARKVVGHALVRNDLDIQELDEACDVVDAVFDELIAFRKKAAAEKEAKAP